MMMDKLMWIEALRRRAGRRLRFLADRVDPRGAPRGMSYSFTFEEHRGIVFRDDGRGCRLWYLGEDDYMRAHTEADSVHAVIDWANARIAARVGGTLPPLPTGDIWMKTTPIRGSGAGG